MIMEGCPESAIVSVRPADQPILVTFIRYERKPGTKNGWIEKERTTLFYDIQQYERFVNAADWFRKRNSKVTQEYAQTKHGYRCVSDTNFSPSRLEKKVTLFDWDY